MFYNVNSKSSENGFFNQTSEDFTNYTFRWEQHGDSESTRSDKDANSFSRQCLSSLFYIDANIYKPSNMRKILRVLIKYPFSKVFRWIVTTCTHQCGEIAKTFVPGQIVIDRTNSDTTVFTVRLFALVVLNWQPSLFWSESLFIIICFENCESSVHTS